MTVKQKKELNLFMIENVDKIDLLLDLIEEATYIRDKLTQLLETTEVLNALMKVRK
jgi:hypothetical protein